MNSINQDLASFVSLASAPRRTLVLPFAPTRHIDAPEPEEKVVPFTMFQLPTKSLAQQNAEAPSCFAVGTTAGHRDNLATIAAKGQK